MLFYGIGALMIILCIGANMRFGKRVPNLNRHVVTPEKIFLVTVFLVVFVIMAMESVQTNNDMLNYEDAFYRYEYSEVQSALQSILKGNDPVYYAISYAFLKAGVGFYTWHAFIALFYAASMYSLINRYSSNIYISIICVLCLGQFNFALGGLRQAMAISILTHAYTPIKEKKLLKFLIIVGIAALFHSSAAVFLIAYPLYRLKLRIRNIVLVAIVGIAGILNAQRLMRLYISVFHLEDAYAGYLEDETTLSIAGMVITASIALFCIVFIMLDKHRSEHAGLCFFSMISFFARVLSTIMFADIFRIALYFSVFDCILIAEACACNQNEKLLRRIKTAAVSLALTAYYFISPGAYITGYVMR